MAQEDTVNFKTPPKKHRAKLMPRDCPHKTKVVNNILKETPDDVGELSRKLKIFEEHRRAFKLKLTGQGDQDP